MLTAQESYELTISLNDVTVARELDEIDAKICRARKEGKFMVDIYTQVSKGTRLVLVDMGYTVKDIPPIHQLDRTYYKIDWKRTEES